MRLRHALAVLLGMLLAAWQSTLLANHLYDGALALALALCLLALWFRQLPVRVATSLLLLACVLLGFGYFSRLAEQRLAQRFAPLEARGDSVTVLAEVVDLPRVSELPGREATRLSLQLRGDPSLTEATAPRHRACGG